MDYKLTELERKAVDRITTLSGWTLPYEEIALVFKVAIELKRIPIGNDFERVKGMLPSGWKIPDSINTDEKLLAFMYAVFEDCNFASEACLLEHGHCHSAYMYYSEKAREADAFDTIEQMKSLDDLFVTPGDWHVDVDNPLLIKTDADPWVVATSEDYARGTSMAARNAKLMTASRELYDACHSVLNHTYAGMLGKELLGKIMKAMKKAELEESLEV